MDIYHWLEPISTGMRNKYFNSLIGKRTNIFIWDFMSLNENDRR